MAFCAASLGLAPQLHPSATEAITLFSNLVRYQINYYARRKGKREWVLKIHMSSKSVSYWIPIAVGVARNVRICRYIT